VLFEDVWNREGLAARDRSLEAITHLAFYAGWPKAMTAVAIAKQVLAD
jgi:4-carboxymuconolactone decarboxylase